MGKRFLQILGHKLLADNHSGITIRLGKAVSRGRLKPTEFVPPAGRSERPSAPRLRFSLESRRRPRSSLASLAGLASETGQRTGYADAGAYKQRQHPANGLAPGSGGVLYWPVSRHGLSTTAGGGISSPYFFPFG